MDDLGNQLFNYLYSLLTIEQINRLEPNNPFFFVPKLLDPKSYEIVKKLYDDFVYENKILFENLNLIGFISFKNEITNNYDYTLIFK